MKKQSKINFMNWAKILFPINRSLAGPGNLKTIKFIEKFSKKKFTIKSFKTNERFFDWKI